MNARAWIPALVLLALPLAAAAYGPGSALTADAPVTLEGRVDSSLPRGIATFLGSGAAQPIVLVLTSDELVVTERTYAPACGGFALPGSTPTCQPGEPEDEEVVLRDARVTIRKVVSAYKVVITTDRTYADTPTFGETGRLLVTSGVTTRLGTNADAMHLSGSETGWSSGGEGALFEPVYEAEALSSEIVSTNAVVRALGGFETFLQGFEVQVSGTNPDGSERQAVFDTRVPSDASEAYRVLVFEARNGDVAASGSAPFTAYAPPDQAPTSDVHDRASFARATGSVTYADDPRGTKDLDAEDVTLQGPLSLTLTKTEAGRVSYRIDDGLRLAAIPGGPDGKDLPPAALAAAGAAGAGGAGLLLALLYLWPRLKYALTLAFLPMYTRIERDAVLEHEKRDELYELIRLAPGIHAHEIGEKARIGWGTTVYHLKLLENHGLIVSKRSGRYKRFFVNTGEYTKKKDVYGALRNETAKAIAEHIVNHPGTTQKDMCAALGIQPSLASWHVEKLEGVELVKRVKDGRMVRYFAGPAWGDLNVRVNPLVGGADTPVET
jgi:DNA-binding transcriptional ArsR family regulator